MNTADAIIDMVWSSENEIREYANDGMEISDVVEEFDMGDIERTEENLEVLWNEIGNVLKAHNDRILWGGETQEA